MSFSLRTQLRSQELVFQEKEFAASVSPPLTSRTFLRRRRLAREIQRNTKFSLRTCQKSGISVLQHLLKILHSIVWLKIGGFDFAASSKFVLLAKAVQPPLPRSDIFTSSNLQCTKCNLSPGASPVWYRGEKTTIPSHTYYLFQTILAPIKVKTVAE